MGPGWLKDQLYGMPKKHPLQGLIDQFAKPRQTMGLSHEHMVMNLALPCLVITNIFFIRGQEKSKCHKCVVSMDKVINALGRLPVIVNL